MIFGKQIINFLETTTIDFNNQESLEKLGIKLPAGYIFHDVRGELCGWDGNRTSVTVTVIEGELKEHWLDVYLIPGNEDTINITYVNDVGTQIGEIQQVNVREGVTIDFNDSKSLESLGIKIPERYIFMKAHSDSLGSLEEGQNQFTIPINGTANTYNITVTVKENISTITVPVKFYNESDVLISSTEVPMDSDGKYTFTTEKCRELCPELAEKTSFTIYIANQWNSVSDSVGNTNDDTSVTVDYNKTYASWTDFKLTDSGSYIYIKAWW